MSDIPGPDVLLDIYRRSIRIRKNDEKFIATIKSGRLETPYYSPRGQEIIPSAISNLLNDQDYVVTIYRGVHDQIAKGLPLRQLWAEYAGKVTGTCKGKGGPMHITHPETGIMVTTGIVGSGLPIANGLALSSQLRGDGRVTICNFGDGASNIGAFHEALNMAQLWKLPVVFVCQNNGYAEHSHYSVGTSGGDIALRAGGYAMVGVTVNGNDPDEMWGAARQAIDRARAGEGPTLLEAKTFRFQGHVLGDGSEYIPGDEFQAALAKDPVPILRARMIGLVGEEIVAEIEREADDEIAEAIRFALESAYPGVDENRIDVLAEVQS